MIHALRSRGRLLVGLAVAGALALTGCGSADEPLAGPSPTPTSSASTSEGAGQVTVGSANFPENVLLAHIYATALRDAGVDVDTRLNIGSRETYLPALQDGSIDLIPEYTGNLMLYYAPDSQATESEAVYDELGQVLPEGLTVLAKAPAEDKDALVVTRATAQQYDLSSIEDLAPVASQLTVGGSPEFKQRRAGLLGLQEVYGLEFAAVRTLDTGGPLTVQALRSGQVDVAQLFTTDPAIAANDFVVLDDPRNIYIAQNVVPLIATSALTDTIRETLNRVSAGLDTQTLASLVARVAGSANEDPAEVAQEWLTSAGLIS